MTAQGRDDRKQPSHQEVRAALGRVVVSPALAKSPQLAQFLTFIVEETLARRGDRLKAYTIATDAFGRDADFDPQADPIVRVEAGRLRQALEIYYTTEGRNDPIIIALPRGHYVPQFLRRTEYSPFARIALAPWRWPLRALPAPFPTAVLIIFGLLAAGLTGIGFERWRQSQLSQASQFSDDPLPLVYVGSIDVIAKPIGSVIAPAHLRTELCNSLARFNEIVLIAGSDCGGPPGNGSITRKDHRRRIDYIVSGTLDFGDGQTAVPTLRLTDTIDGAMVWAHTFRPIRLDATADHAQDAVVRHAAVTIAQPNGVIQMHERIRRATGANIDARYACLLDYNTYRQNFDPAAHEPAKACLKRTIAADPTFAVAYAALARLYAREFYTQFGVAEEGVRPLDRALRLAQRAMELDPESAEAYAVLMAVQYSRRDMTAARAAGDKAMALNPDDMGIQAEYGYMLLRQGEVDRATRLMREAVASGYLATPIINYALFAGAYLTGNMDEATRYADAIATDNYPVGLSAKALVAEKSGNRELALTSRPARRAAAGLEDRSPARAGKGVRRPGHRRGLCP